MGSPRAFLEVPRESAQRRPVAERLGDFAELELPMAEPVLERQGSRCMDCGVPYCHSACPLGNLIPDFNAAVEGGRWPAAVASLLSTNNFPEFTGRVCPAPCEASCVLNLEGQPVAIKSLERAIADRALAHGALTPRPSTTRSGRRVAIVGSGPAGLAAAQQLARAGHAVTVFEKADRLGGLLRYGIPDFKLEKRLLDDRLEQLRAEGVVFRTQVEAGVHLLGRDLRRDYHAVVLAAGASQPRDLQVPGRELAGVHFAMEYLTQQNRRVAGDAFAAGSELLATGKHVVVLGGGDTGSDCVGTALRQHAKSVRSLELRPRPPDQRTADDLWPTWPHVFRTSSSHQEGGERDFAVMATSLVGDGRRVVGLNTVRVEFEGAAPRLVPGSEQTLPAELVLLAMGFWGPTSGGLLEQLGVQLDSRGNVLTTGGRTSVEGVFAAGDVSRGASLVVWAIAEGRAVAAAVDAWLLRPATPQAQQ